MLENPSEIEQLKAGSFDLGADTSAVALESGAAASARFSEGTTVFVMPRGGLMAGVSISGQQIQYRPLAG